MKIEQHLSTEQIRTLEDAMHRLLRATWPLPTLVAVGFRYSIERDALELSLYANSPGGGPRVGLTQRYLYAETQREGFVDDLLDAFVALRKELIAAMQEALRKQGPMK